jgi:molybdopterin molybdotransferase
MKSLEQLAAELQGYDPQALSVAGVQAFMQAWLSPFSDLDADSECLDFRHASLHAWQGRVLAADVVSPLSVPPHDNSAMDGYAFAGDALQLVQSASPMPSQGAQTAASATAYANASASATATTNAHVLRLRVVGTALAGKAWQGVVAAGECVKIMTGAVMPAGLDTVVPQELCSVEQVAGQDHAVFSAKALAQGDNRRFKGEDLMQGGVALRQGQRLNAAALGMLASLGLTQVRVWRRLRVAYFSTGDEILNLGETPREGAVYDSNRYTLRAMLAKLGIEMIDLGLVRDEPAALEAAFSAAAAQADVVITSGGVSVGEADFTKAMMKKLGEVLFWRIAMRPGRPMAVGRIASSAPSTGAKPAHAILFGLPGNPVAVMVTFLAFVRPALLRLMGAAPEATPLLKAQSTAPLRKRPGRTEYQRGLVALNAAGQLVVSAAGNQGSGVLSSMAQANGLIVLHHDQASVAAGDWVDVLMLDGLI